MQSNSLYEHHQQSLVWVLAIMPLVGASVVVVASNDYVSAWSVWSGIVFFAVFTLFMHGSSALLVTVSTVDVSLRWRFGWPSKTIERSEITAVEIVRTKWWYGFGIRAKPLGWLWNVWGLDAVRLSLTSGKQFTIGTDDPAGLRAALS